MNQPYRPSHKGKRNLENPAARADRPARSENPAARADRPARSENPAARADKPARSENPAARSDGAGRFGKPARADRPARYGKPAHSTGPAGANHPARFDKPARTDKPVRSDQPAQAHKSGRSGKPFRSGPPVRYDKPARAENPAAPADKPVKIIVPVGVPEPNRGQTAQADSQPTFVHEQTAGSPDRLEGRNPILEAIKAGRTINKLWVAKREEKPDPALGRLITLAREAGAVVMETDRRVLDQMSETHGHQGVIAQVAAHEYVELDDMIARPLERGETPFLLVLSELQESYNLGSILRIADAAGIHGVIIPQRRSVGLDAAVAKASAGAIEHVPVCRVNNLSQTVERLKEQGFWIVGTDTAGTVEYHAVDWQGPLAVLVGGESEGISLILRKHCDFLISIPMHGQVNSLNAAVATGIIVFEAAHQRAGHPLAEKGSGEDKESDIGE